MNFGLSVAALTAGLAAAWLMAPWRHANWAQSIPYAPLIPCLCIVVVIALAEKLFPGLRNPNAVGFVRRTQRPVDLRRVGERLCGLLTTVALVALAYWLFPEYHGDFYEPYWRFLRTLAPAIVLIPFYFLWADTRMSEVRDEYQALGGAVLGRARPGDGELIR